jgi:hypothetical protein
MGMAGATQTRMESEEKVFAFSSGKLIKATRILITIRVARVLVGLATRARIFHSLSGLDSSVYQFSDRISPFPRLQQLFSLHRCAVSIHSINE